MMSSVATSTGILLFFDAVFVLLVRLNVGLIILVPRLIIDIIVTVVVSRISRTIHIVVLRLVPLIEDALLNNECVFVQNLNDFFDHVCWYHRLLGGTWTTTKLIHIRCTVVMIHHRGWVVRHLTAAYTLILVQSVA